MPPLRFCPADGSCHLFISDLFWWNFNFWINYTRVPFPTFLWDAVSYLAAIPPCRRLETLGLPSLSIPPDTVSPRVVPSFFINSTMVEPLNSSVKRKAFALLNEIRSTRWFVCEVTSPHELFPPFLLWEKIWGLFSSQFAEYHIKGECIYSIIGY